jgi:hypothetical protein
MIVTTRDVFTIPGFSKRHGFCRGGARAWFRSHGLDWNDFVRNGIEEEKLLAVGDAFAIATVKWAHERAATEAAIGAQPHG